MFSFCVVFFILKQDWQDARYVENPHSHKAMVVLWAFIFRGNSKLRQSLSITIKQHYERFGSHNLSTTSEHFGPNIPTGSKRWCRV